MHYVYIIFSESVQKFYIGETEDITERLVKHNSGAYKNAFTSQACDWEIQTVIACENRTIALKIEKHIKSMKSKVYVNNLTKHEELRERLISRFSN
jgi:putative endonuclease